MLTTLVVTVMGPDRPGLVRTVATAIADHGGNWLESRMCHLGGQFAGLLRVEADEARLPELAAALEGLADGGLRVLVQPGGAPEDTSDTARHVELDIVGQDRPGILRHVTGVLAAHRVNIEELSSERTSAPMGGGTLFHARVSISVPPSVTLAAVRADLEAIATDLMVDVAVIQEG